MYTARKYFLWVWVVVNDKGTPVYYGTRLACRTFAGLLNEVWMDGFIRGKIVETEIQSL